MDLKCFGSGSRGNSYMLNIGCNSILIDAGVPIKRMDIDMTQLSKVDALLISHEHL